MYVKGFCTLTSCCMTLLADDAAAAEAVALLSFPCGDTLLDCCSSHDGVSGTLSLQDGAHTNLHSCSSTSMDVDKAL